MIAAVRGSHHLNTDHPALRRLLHMADDALKRAFSRLYGNQFSPRKFSLQQNSETTGGYVSHDAESTAQGTRPHLPIDSDAQVRSDASVLPPLFQFRKVARSCLDSGSVRRVIGFHRGTFATLPISCLPVERAGLLETILAPSGPYQSDQDRLVRLTPGERERTNCFEPRWSGRRCQLGTLRVFGPSAPEAVSGDNARYPVVEPPLRRSPELARRGSSITPATPAASRNLTYGAIRLYAQTIR